MSNTTNILLEPTFKTLHGTAPFTRIGLKDYEPAFIEGFSIYALGARYHDAPYAVRNLLPLKKLRRDLNVLFPAVGAGAYYDLVDLHVLNILRSTRVGRKMRQSNRQRNLSKIYLNGALISIIICLISLILAIGEARGIRY